MTLLERVKETLRTEERIVWECTDCGETFTSSVAPDAETPDSEPCEACESTDVQLINRAYG